MEGYSNHSVYVCVCYHLISETTRFHYPDEFSMDGTSFKKASNTEILMYKHNIVEKILQF